MNFLINCFKCILVLLVVGCAKESDYKLPQKNKEVISNKADFQIFKPEVDVLFVIDDSGSMSTHQKRLAANINQFTEGIFGNKIINFNIGVITSSAAKGGLLKGNPKFVTRNTPDAVIKLAANLQVGTSGDATERFFDPLFMALTAPAINGYNAGFLRPNAILAVILITDTNDQSVNQNAETIIQFLVDLKKGRRDKLLVAGAYIETREAAKTCSAESWFGEDNNLKYFFEQTQGITFSLCDPFYGERLSEIASEIIGRAREVKLAKLPKQKTIKVTVAGLELPEDVLTGWTYLPEKNAILFGPYIDWSTYPDDVFPQIDFEPRELPFN